MMELSKLLTLDFMSQINQIAIKAGEAIMQVYQRGFKVEQKNDESPLTEADLAAHHVIVSALGKLSPEIPILSEESATIEWQERKTWQTYWLIDPLDGTKEFIKRNGEFTVNIALIHQHKPILGVVCAPVTKTLYYANQQLGSWLKPSTEKDGQISVKIPVPKKLRIVGSRSHQSELLIGYLQQFDDYELVPMGSSLKICLIAEGKADLYPRLGPTSEWDTAAAHAVLKFAGGSCQIAETRQELSYNTKDCLLNPHFIAQAKEQ